jgi:lactoylglutathione lyase
LRSRADANAEFATEGAKFALFPRSELPVLIGRDAAADPAPWPHGDVAFFVDDSTGACAAPRRGRPCARSADWPWGERTPHVADPDPRARSSILAQVAAARAGQAHDVLGIRE